MTKAFLALCAAGLAALAAAHAQEGAPIAYRVSFENAAHHEAQISVTFRDIGDQPLELRMSRASPGRYALHEFAKNVYAVTAVDGAGQNLAVTRTDPYSWRITDHNGSATVTYTLYADLGDGTYSQIDLTHAHLNMPATFMWAREFEDRPITISFDLAQGNWKAATQLQPTRRALSFSAPDLQYFMDSPIELSNFGLRQWRIGEGDARQMVRLAVHHDGEDEDLDMFAEKAKTIVAEHIKMFGEAPQFDYGVYTFIADYLPTVDGDGMEHRNSTILTRSGSLFEDDFAQIHTLSHEFFHVWNVERLRPAELEPFDFSKANPTPSLWFAEGFTSYYGPLLIRRAGENSVEDFLSRLSGQFDYVFNAPGRQISSPQKMSLRAPFADDATANDPTNFANTFVSYYPYGAIVALALDLSIRQQFDDLSLDDYMRYLWSAYGKPEKPYTHNDLRDALGSVTGDQDFAKEFFARYIEDGDLPDFAPLLEQAGLKLQPKNKGDAWLGRVRFEEDGKALIIASNTIIGSPLYQAGLDRGDELISVGRFTIDDEKDWKRALSRHDPGESTTIVYRQRGSAKRSSIVFAEDETLEIQPIEDDELSDIQTAFRDAWLGSDVIENDNIE